VASLAFILITSVYPAMRTINTDFANYLLPARLVVQGQPTSRLYEFSWFQRQMAHAGMEHAGAFSFFPPAAGLVHLPVAALDPLLAKRVWTALNLAALLGLVGILASAAGITFSVGLVFVVLAGSAVRNNFLFGQSYIVLALCIAGALSLIQRGRSGLAGALLGAGAAVKLYPTPFLLFFLYRRDWRAAGGFVAGALLVLALAVFAFGWELNAFWFQGVLPRILRNQVDNGFHPATQSVTGILYRLLLREPTLNPDPLLHAPFLFYLLRDVMGLGLLVLLFVSLRRSGDVQELSILVVGFLVLSPMMYSYHVFLALITITCQVPRLWQRGARLPACLLITLFALATFGAGRLPREAYVRLWSIIGILGILIWQLQPRFSPHARRLAIPAVLVLSLVHAAWMSQPQPTDGATPLAWDGQVDSPTATQDGLVYASLGCSGCFGWTLRGHIPPNLPITAHALSPTFASRSGRLFFEVAGKGHTQIVEYRDGSVVAWTPPELQCSQPTISPEGTRLVAICRGILHVFNGPQSGRPVETLEGEVADPALSPDGRRLAFAWRRHGRWHLAEIDITSGDVHRPTQGRGDERWPRYDAAGQRLAFSRWEDGVANLWVLDLQAGSEQQITWSRGNDTQPEWSPSGDSIYFSSDRGGGVFRPVVYRIDL
jgi:hypothetical protein